LSERPVLYVLAGVNGAGKSSIGGANLVRQGQQWFNPDTFARWLVAEAGYEVPDANAAAWAEGLRRLDESIADGSDFAFETTLGGKTIPARIKAAAASHDVLMWYCGLASVELHIARVAARVIAGGHDIPESKIRMRCVSSLSNLIDLMPSLAQLHVYDNSVTVAAGEPLPDPALVLTMEHGKLTWPIAIDDQRRTPVWARSLLQAARTR
jgi:predicted ABC-type ATPase